MNSKHLSKLIAVAILFSFQTFAVDGDPQGENASYILNKDRERTSWLIKSGTGTALVGEKVDHEELGPCYEVSIEYEFDVRFIGKNKGTIGLLVPERVFLPTFYSQLREDQSYSFGSFDVEHLGVTDAKDADDNYYEICDEIKIFNIDKDYQPISLNENNTKIIWFKSEGILNEVENLEIKMRVDESLPVLGSVQIDVSGRAQGTNFKAGMDFAPAL
jgi:hypothetical protein